MTAAQPVPARLQTLLEDRFERVVAAFGQARFELSEPVVHELRVACRRLSAGLQILPGWTKTRRRLRKLRNLAEELRELHVLSLWIEPRLEEWPDLGLVYRRLARLIRKESRRVSRKLDRFPLGKLKKAAARLTVPPDVSVLESAQRLESELYALVESQADWHEIRLALKHYRYQAELVHALGLARPPLEKLRSWQEQLGRMQDLEVQSNRLEAFYRRLKPKREGILAFATHCRAERDRLVSELNFH